MLKDMLEKTQGSVAALESTMQATSKADDLEQLRVIRSKGQGICDILIASIEMGLPNLFVTEDLVASVAQYNGAVSKYVAVTAGRPA